MGIGPVGSVQPVRLRITMPADGPRAFRWFAGVYPHSPRFRRSIATAILHRMNPGIAIGNHSGLPVSELNAGSVFPLPYERQA
jgi:hypothetical protein